jgi:hypothetical protein
MRRSYSTLMSAVALVLCSQAMAQPSGTGAGAPATVYVPYKELKTVMDASKQGVFVPYDEFQKLWRAAQGAPAGADGAAIDYLVSTARFKGTVGNELATVQLELTVDVLSEGWKQIPLGLAEVAVAKAAFAGAAAGAPEPLLRVIDGQYVLLTRDKGRHTLVIDFVAQIKTAPGLNVLGFRIPRAAISTLELLIPEENLKVDVEPMLAASTTPVAQEGKQATKLLAFLGSADSVKLSWKPRSQAAQELEPVIVVEQLEQISVQEAVVRYDVTFNYDIRRRGVDSLTIQLPSGFRVTAVEGAALANWDTDGGGGAASMPASAPATTQASQPAGQLPAGVGQVLSVKLFDRVKDQYKLTVRMERFLEDRQAELSISPVVTRQALRQVGLVAVSQAPRRWVEVASARNIDRVDVSALPEPLRTPGTTAWRFYTADRGMKLQIGTVQPRVTAEFDWTLGVRSDSEELAGKLRYTVERAGVFSLGLQMGRGWRVSSVEPREMVEDFRLSESGELTILLRRELTGVAVIDVRATRARESAEAPVEFVMPTPPAGQVERASAVLGVLLSEELRAEVGELRQLQGAPLGAAQFDLGPRMSLQMQFAARQLDVTKPAGASLRIAQKPSQVSAAVYRLTNIQHGMIDEEAIVQFMVRYAPVDTFYIAVPASLADSVEISGADIKEKPRVSAAQASGAQRAQTQAATMPAEDAQTAYFRISLQAPVLEAYTLRVHARRAFALPEAGSPVVVDIQPILAAGKLVDQTGVVAIAKAPTIALDEPTRRENLEAADPSSALDVPWEAHRNLAAVAFQYSKPPFALSLPVRTQKEVRVLTTLADLMFVEQSLARDGRLSSRALYLIRTSVGDRLALSLPPEAQAYSFLLNGQETPVEAGPGGSRIVRLPPSAGEVSRAVLEVRYGQSGASASRLAAPSLTDSAGTPVPVQQVLWRVQVSPEDVVLHYGSAFSRTTPHQVAAVLDQLRLPEASPSVFQGQDLMLSAQGPGAPAQLSLLVVNRAAMVAVIWLVVAGAGVLLLRFAWRTRFIVLLAAAGVVALVRLAAPMLGYELWRHAATALLLVLVLWLIVAALRPGGKWRWQAPAPKTAEGKE